MRAAPTKLAEVCESVRYGFTASACDDAIGPKFLRITDIVPESINWDSVPYCPIEDEDRERCALRPGDIVVARTGATVGYAKLIREEVDAVFASYLVRFRVDEKKADSGFVGRLVESSIYKSFVQSQVGGAAQPNANAQVLGAFEFSLPSRPEQERIADVLSAYDEFMENNRRRMGLLEEAARLLYREWFVHLRFPGHEHTRMIHGLPEGWAKKPLADIAEFRLGKMLDQNKNRGDLKPYLANVNVRWGEFDLRELREMRFEHHELETYGLKVGDIVMCEGGEPGRCAIWKEQMPGMMIQKAIHRIRCRENMDHVFLYHSLRHQGQSGQLATLFTGATIKHLPREKLAKVTVAVPPRRLLDLFSSQTHPIERQLVLLEAANKRASEARDLLLPRLMSGEIAA